MINQPWQGPTFSKHKLLAIVKGAAAEQTAETVIKLRFF
jgi:hypothetical protein